MNLEEIASVSLVGKTVMITGAASELGCALALAFGKAGASVAANDLNPDALRKTVRLIEKQGGIVMAFPADVAKESNARRLVAETVEVYGSLDILVNNASLMPASPLFSMDPQEWQRIMDVNLNAPFWLIQAAAGPMRAGGGGVVLNIATGEAPTASPHGRAAYFASKAGLIALTRAAASEAMIDGVRIHALCPSARAGAEEDPDRERRIEVGICRLALYLCSEAAEQLTGKVLNVELSPSAGG